MILALMMGCGPKGVQGSPKDVTIVPGDHEGYLVGRCEGTDTWWIQGTGSQSPDLYELLDDTLWTLPNITAYSAGLIGVRSCREDGLVGPDGVFWVATSDYTAVDGMIEAFGSRLRESDAEGHVQIDILALRYAR